MSSNKNKKNMKVNKAKEEAPPVKAYKPVALVMPEKGAKAIPPASVVADVAKLEIAPKSKSDTAVVNQWAKAGQTGSSVIKTAAAVVPTKTQSSSTAARVPNVVFDKQFITNLFTSGKSPSDSVANWYPTLSQIERMPVVPVAQIPDNSKVPHPDEAAIFDTEHMKAGFHYDPTKQKDVNDPDVIIGKANLILNKLSVEKFDKLSDEFMRAGVCRESMIDQVVDLIVFKARQQESFCFMYANLCRKIIDVWSAVAEHEAISKQFKVKLLTKCASEFSVDVVVKCADVGSNEEFAQDVKDEETASLRQKYFGLMRFMGELYNKNLFKQSTMGECLKKFLETKEDELNIVFMYKLFETVGKRFEEKDVVKKKGGVTSGGVLITLFKDIEAIASDTSYSSHSRYMCNELLILRSNGWNSKYELDKVNTSAVTHMRTPTASTSSSTATMEDSEWSVVVEKGPKAKYAAANAPEPQPASVRGGKFDFLSQNFSAPASGNEKMKKKKGKKSSFNDSGNADDGLVGWDDDINSPVTDLPAVTVRSINGLIQDYVANETVGEACEAIKTLPLHKKRHPAVIHFVISRLFERCARERELLTSLLCELLLRNVCDVSTMTLGLFLLVDSFDDLQIDNPLLCDYLAGIFSQLLHRVPNFTLSFFSSVPSHNMFMSSACKAEVVAKTLKQWVTLTSETHVLNSYVESGIQLSDWVSVPPKGKKHELVANFSTKFGLGFLSISKEST